MNRKGTVFTVGLFKGGVGKTTVSTLLSYRLAQKGYKVLLVDFDPQANATNLMIKTKVAAAMKEKVKSYDEYFSSEKFKEIWSKLGNLKLYMYRDFFISYFRIKPIEKKIASDYSNVIVYDYDSVLIPEYNMTLPQLLKEFEFDYENDMVKDINGKSIPAYYKKRKTEYFLSAGVKIDYNNDIVIFDDSHKVNIEMEDDPINLDEIGQIENTLMSAIASGSLKGAEMNIVNNLDLLPNFSDFVAYPLYLEDTYQLYNDRIKSFKPLLDQIKYNYDFVIIDVPPTISAFTDNALVASDYTIITLQPHEDSLVGAKSYTSYIAELSQKVNPELDILGVLPVLLKAQSSIDLEVLSDAQNYFKKENMFKSIIHYRDRINRFKRYGITNNDHHDLKVLKMVDDVVDEFLKKLENKEKIMG